MIVVDFLEAAIGVLLVLCILLQSRASGLSQTFGGSGVTYVQRRGAEKLLYRLSIILSILFFGIAVLQWFFN